MPVTKLEIASRSQFANGESFGDTGPYELVEGKAYFAVDPLNPRNQVITDVDMAPRNSAGKVAMSADFAVLTPAENGRGNRSLLVDVVNRGGKTAITGLNSARAVRSEEPTSELHSRA